MNLRDEINNILLDNKIDGIKFLRLNNYQAILNRFADCFLTNGRASLKSIWLWDSFKESTVFIQPENTIQKIASMVNSDEDYWFIASDEDGKYWVLEGLGLSIQKLLNESRYFEYYLIDKNFNWVICENHHGTLIVKGNIPKTIDLQGNAYNIATRCISHINLRGL